MTDTAKTEIEQNDRELAASFAPPSVRARLNAFHAWIREIEDIPYKTTEPAILAMRFAWHREAVADLFAMPARIRRHDAYEGMAPLIKEADGPDAAELVQIIDAVEDGLDQTRLTDITALLQVIDAQSGTAMRIAERLSGGAASEALRTAAARASGLAHWVRGFAVRAGRMLALIPHDALDRAGINVHRLASGREPERAAAAFAPVLDVLEAELAKLGELPTCPPESYPVLGVARLARATLKTARRSDDLYRTDFRPYPLLRQIELLRGSLTGRLA
ncbi:squalene/phytoene synthase family protein [Hyphobacterium sp.]|uniref:squalene/phytoene synthase family protein n=1 Tax=Hyphobacterium sp. TaxID=2004662 RepID=UPI003B52BD24